MADRPDSPNVWFPPPFVYAAAVGGGLLLERRWSLPIGAGIGGVAAGWLLAILGAAVMFSGFGTFLARRTSVIPHRPASSLVISGPYRFTRNPMYLGLALITAGFGLFFDTWWPLLLLVPAVWIIQRTVIAPEEAYLRRRFGADYVEYSHRVRRWI
jgi:protein-S-isoprenylcysteine O-methyltransferase Ste14